MLSSEFAEDVFKEFYNLISQQKISVQGQDFSPIASFHEKIINGNELTKNQANFLVKLLEKYKTISAMAGVDYQLHLQNLKWRREFRVLDLSKKIYVELRENKLEICLKFPYQLKKQFEDEIDNGQTTNLHSFWDHEQKVRRLDFYRYNLIALYEFALTHNFEIDDTFMNVLADVEEIWQNSEDIIPRSEITIYGVALKNATETTQQWWEEHRSNDPLKDLLLAKSMGFLYQEKPTNLVEKIASCSENTFWIKNYRDFFALTKLFSGKICVLLDRTTAYTLLWLQNFVEEADNSGILREEIKVCFRNDKELDNGLNDWVKTAGVGGQVESGKILIFDAKPAKWLFKSDIDVTMLATNNIFPPASNLAKDWVRSHPCVIYLGDTKPTELKGQKIVEL